MIRDLIHTKVLEHKDEVQSWFQEQKQGLFFPFYSSIDIRDSGYKVVPVDSNLFPAGFNNICRADRDGLKDVVRDYLEEYHPKLTKVALLMEEHTRNPHYLDNVWTLKNTLEQAGLEVYTCMPGQNVQLPLTLESAQKKSIHVQSLAEVADKIDFIICNNDFSKSYALPENIPVNPPPEMGWSSRRKSWFFEKYNELASQFATIIGVDPWHITIKTQLFSPFDLKNRESVLKLKQDISIFLKELKPHYDKLSLEPYTFLKNNSGTYGLGITHVKSAEELDEWNYKTKKKMKAVKGGGQFNQLILQEGIPTITSTDGVSSEPVIYMIGDDLVGGFLRINKEKGVRDNLNSPGSVFRGLCMSDLKIQEECSEECSMEENVYGWIAKLSSLALAKEIQQHSKSK